MKDKIKLLVLFCFSFINACSSLQGEKGLSASEPVAFVYAGPEVFPSSQGGMMVQFRFVLSLLAVQADHIQIIDLDTGRTLVDDTKPYLHSNVYTLNDKPNTYASKWEGHTGPIAITTESPYWLHENNATVRNIKATVYKDGDIIASTQKKMVFDYLSKVRILTKVQNKKPY